MSKDTSNRKVRNYKFRLYPNKTQQYHLLRWIETNRRVYNNCLAQRQDAWKLAERIRPPQAI